MYFEINNSGCSERKGMVQVRYDLFLDEQDYGYEKHYVKVDGKMQNNPFLCHFCQFEPSVTDEELLFVGELAMELAYKAWKTDRPHGVINQLVDFPLNVTSKRKKDCNDRLEKIKNKALKKKVTRVS